jgi:hypothetical protein
MTFFTRRATDRIETQLKTAVAALVLAMVSGLVNAQSQPGAEGALLIYGQATKTFDTRQMSALMHPDALRRFRKTIDAALAGPKKDLAAKELLQLFSLTKAEDFAELSDIEAYKRLNDTIVKLSPDVVDMMKAATFEIVGSFLKDDLAYVTYNLGVTVDGTVVTTQVVQKLKLHDGKWLLMLPSTAEASIAAIETRFN